MKVEGPNSIRPGTGAARKRRGGDDAGFAAELADVDGQGQEPAGTAPVAPSPAVEALLAIQGGDDREADQRRAMARGDDILDRLDALRRDILLGAIPRDRLRQLTSAVASHRASVQDPQLGAILDEIDLRAQVELAKWDRDG